MGCGASAPATQQQQQAVPASAPGPPVAASSHPTLGVPGQLRPAPSIKEGKYHVFLTHGAGRAALLERGSCSMVNSLKGGETGLPWPSRTLLRRGMHRSSNAATASHPADWGNADELGRNNHDTVTAVNEALKKRGLVTWFDSDRLVGSRAWDLPATLRVFFCPHFAHCLPSSRPCSARRKGTC